MSINSDTESILAPFPIFPDLPPFFIQHFSRGFSIYKCKQLIYNKQLLAEGETETLILFLNYH